MAVDTELVVMGVFKRELSVHLHMSHPVTFYRKKQPTVIKNWYNLLCNWRQHKEGLSVGNNLLSQTAQLWRCHTCIE